MGDIQRRKNPQARTLSHITDFFILPSGVPPPTAAPFLHRWARPGFAPNERDSCAACTDLGGHLTPGKESGGDWLAGWQGWDQQV